MVSDDTEMNGDLITIDCHTLSAWLVSSLRSGGTTAYSMMIEISPLLLELILRHPHRPSWFLLLLFLDLSNFLFLVLGWILDVMKLLLLLDAGFASPLKARIPKVVLFPSGVTISFRLIVPRSSRPLTSSAP
jgi:hypothetical protein